MQIYAFFTSRNGRRCTVGLLVVGEKPSTQAAAAIYHKFKPHLEESNCHAHGKVAFINPHQSWAVFQIDDDGEAGRCSCGNAIAAGAALSARALNWQPMAANVIVPDGEILVRFAAAHIYPVVVYQRWQIGKIEVEDRSNGSNHIGRIRGVNDYWVINGDRDVNLAGIIGDVNEACSTRIARVNLAARKPSIKFLTCGGKRQHGGLPLTGAIAVSIAARRLPWLRPLEIAGEFESAAGTHKLLSIDETTGTVDLPITHVEYERIT